MGLDATESALARDPSQTDVGGENVLEGNDHAPSDHDSSVKLLMDITDGALTETLGPSFSHASPTEQGAMRDEVMGSFGEEIEVIVIEIHKIPALRNLATLLRQRAQAILAPAGRLLRKTS